MFDDRVGLSIFLALYCWTTVSFDVLGRNCLTAVSFNVLSRKISRDDSREIRKGFGPVLMLRSEVKPQGGSKKRDTRGGQVTMIAYAVVHVMTMPKSRL